MGGPALASRRKRMPRVITGFARFDNRPDPPGWDDDDWDFDRPKVRVIR